MNGEVTHARVTASSGSGATVLAARARRFFLGLQATGETCYVTLDGTTPSATNGMILYADSAGITLTRDSGVPTRAVKAFSVGGTGVIHATETYL